MRNKIPQYKNTPDYIESLSDYLLGIKNLSKVYINNLITTIKQFIDFNNQRLFNLDSIDDVTLNDIRTLDNDDIHCFIFYLVKKGYKESSRNQKLEHIRTFFNFLYRIKHNLFQEPMKKVNRERKNRVKIPKYLSIKQAKQLLNIYSDGTDFNQIRDNAIYHLFLNCGLRLSELVNLNISDFNLKNNTFLIFGKGSKERTGYLNKVTKDALLKYLEVRNKICVNNKDKDALFLSSGINIRRISKSIIYKNIQKTYNKLNLNRFNYNVHSLRHTCATILYRSGIDIRTIQAILGHVRIETTEIYTHTSDKELEKEMLNHPMGKFKMRNAKELVCEVA